MAGNDENIRSVLSDKVCRYVTLILLFPSFLGFLGGGAITLGQMIYTFGVAMCGLFMLYLRKLGLSMSAVIVAIFLCQLACCCITLVINAIDFNCKISLTDFSDLTRPVLYLMFYSTSYSLCRGGLSIDRLNRFLIWSIIGLAVFDVIKFLPAGVFVLKFYTPLSPGSFNYVRFSGTFAYCYNYAYVLIFALLLALLWCRRSVFPVVIILVLVILTGSRSALIATGVAMLIYYFSVKSFFKAVTHIAFAVVGIGLLLAILYSLQIPFIVAIFDNVEKLIDALSGVGEDGSLSTRNSQLAHVMENFHLSPFFGVGPQKGVSKPIEMQLGYYLSSWGIVGLICYLVQICYFLYISKKSSKSSDFGRQAFSRANFIWILISFISGMSTPITDQIRVSQLFYAIQGVQFYLYAGMKSEQKNYLSCLIGERY